MSTLEPSPFTVAICKHGPHSIPPENCFRVTVGVADYYVMSRLMKSGPCGCTVQGWYGVFTWM